MQASNNEDVSSNYSQLLSRLTRAWATARRDEMSSLNQFVQACIDLRTFSQEHDFAALYSVLSKVLKVCDSVLQQNRRDKNATKEIEWLLNQLLRGSTDDIDPFIQVPGTYTNANDDTLDESGSSPEPDVIIDGTDILSTRDAPRQRSNIAVIDDQVSIGKALTMALEDFSLNAQFFESIDEFKEVMNDTDIDLVLLDIVMPNVTQEQVFNFARELVEKGIKVISCSATFTLETRLLAVRANVSDYIVKPINTYVLVEKISRVLEWQKRAKFNVVIVDDQQTMGEFYQTMLEQAGCNVKFYKTAAQLFDSLEDLSPDIFLLDMNMPDVNGIEIAKMLRQEQKFEFVPIIFITAEENKEEHLLAVEAGAEDVITKSLPVQLITRQINQRLMRASELKAFVATDQLTGVLNHGQIVETANQTIRLSNRRKTCTAIAVIDVDRFKTVNDKYGHLMGDKVLCALGQLLSASVRETDHVGRYGGEEFVIVFVDCDLDDAAKKVQYIKDNFNRMTFNGGNKSEAFSVSFSAGVVDLLAFDNIQEAIGSADKALYKAKEQGRNKVIKYRLK